MIVSFFDLDDFSITPRRFTIRLFATANGFSMLMVNVCVCVCVDVGSNQFIRFFLWKYEFLSLCPIPFDSVRSTFTWTELLSNEVSHVQWMFLICFARIWSSNQWHWHLTLQQPAPVCIRRCSSVVNLVRLNVDLNFQMIWMKLVISSNETHRFCFYIWAMIY